MLDEKLDLDDLHNVDAQHYLGLMNILNTPLETLGMDGLTFTTETSFFGQISSVDLIPNGSQVTVRAASLRLGLMHVSLNVAAGTLQL